MEIRQLLNDKLLPKLVAIDQSTNLTPWSLKNYQSMLNDPYRQIFALMNDETICGACVSCYYPPDGEILQLVVASNYQRLGHAQMLLEYCMAKLASFGIEQLFLEVRANNIAAINLYHKVGFFEIDIRKNYYLVNQKRIDAIIMSRKL